MEPFKNIFNAIAVDQIAQAIKKNFPPFNEKSFSSNINKDLEQLELKDRVKLITLNLHQNLDLPYKKVAKILIASLKSDKNHSGIDGFLTWPIAQLIETYGLHDFDTSFNVLYEVTQRFTAEFAIRPFLEKDPNYVYQKLFSWMNDKNPHIRRLCSEGTRPNLPWGMKVKNLDLAKNLKILKALRSDNEKYVQKSVANHLNDISRINKKLMIQTCIEWSKLKNKNTDWIIRHASRSLLKSGDKEILQLHGYKKNHHVKVSTFKLDSKKIIEGENLNLKIKLINQSSKTQKIIIDYVIYFLRSNNSHSKKVFRIKDMQIKKEEILVISKSVSFRKVTTRKHYEGNHFISIQVNGVESSKIKFELYK